MSRVWTPLVGGVVAVLVGFGAEEARADCVAGVARGDTLRIRTGPGVQHGETGGIPPGACGVRVTGGCRGQWCPVAWNGRSGWSNGHYLTRDTQQVRTAPFWSPFASLFAPPPSPRFVPPPQRPERVASMAPKPPRRTAAQESKPDPKVSPPRSSRWSRRRRRALRWLLHRQWCRHRSPSPRRQRTPPLPQPRPRATCVRSACAASRRATR